jgi:ribosomal protein S18 acetylase RimI-like enzyme
MQARRGELVDVLAGEGMVASREGRGVGVITWLVEAKGESAEIRAVAVEPESRGQGISRALFGAAHEALASAGVRSAWLVTTNDNAPAIRLYESLGYEVLEVRPGAIDEIRRTIKPSISLAGHGGVEMHDEIELGRSIPTP